MLQTVAFVHNIAFVITRFTSYYCFLESTSESHHSHGLSVFLSTGQKKVTEEDMIQILISINKSSSSLL